MRTRPDESIHVNVVQSTNVCVDFKAVALIDVTISMASKSTKKEANVCSASLSLKDGKINVKGPTIKSEKRVLSHRAQDAEIRKENIQQRSRIGATSGAATGAAVGAVVGSVVPVVGTAVGAAIGALFGFGIGYAAGGQVAAIERPPPPRRKTWRCCYCCVYSTEK